MSENLPSYMVSTARGEWHSRTVYGKILYPGWFVSSAFMWLIFGMIVGLVAVLRVLNTAIDRVISLLPSKYKRGDTDRSDPE